MRSPICGGDVKPLQLLRDFVLGTPTSYRIVFREVEMHAVCNDYIAVAHNVQFFSMWAFLFTYVTAVKDWTSEEDALLLQRKRIVVSMDRRSLSWAISLTNYFS